MLKQLRFQFILTNMLLVFLALLAVFSVLMLSTARQLEQESYTALELALRWEDRDGPPSFLFDLPENNLENEQNNSRFIPAFCVTVNGDGEVKRLTSGRDTQVSDEVLEQAVELALDSGQCQGLLGSLDLRFKTWKVSEEETRIAFSDLGWEQASLTRLLLNLLLVGVAALAGFFFISLFLSRQALRPAARAWEQQNQFVADASHELKTPLTVILANTSIVLSHPDKTVAENRKWLDYIQEEALRMKILVEDLLFLAKNEGSRLPSPQPVPFSDLVEGCLLRFEPVAFEHGVELTSQVDSGAVLSGDQDSLERLAMILLDNAVKYAGEGGHVSLTLAVRSDRVHLEVQNTGAPIPPEHLSHLFERFYRADSSRSRDQGGYGLGLAIAQAVARAHRGEISVSSDSVRGTVFLVSLPLS